MVWGFAAWAFYPAQQARLISIVGPQGASIILSVNASFHYFGFSVGAALGALVLSVGGVRDLGWAGALCVAAACALEYLPARKAFDPASSPLPHSTKCASGSAVR